MWSGVNKRSSSCRGNDSRCIRGLEVKNHESADVIVVHSRHDFGIRMPQGTKLRTTGAREFVNEEMPNCRGKKERRNRGMKL